MKCNKCGCEWNIPQGMNAAISSCPFCGASLISDEDNLESIMRWIVQTRGISVFLNENTINGILSDLIQHDDRNKKQIKIALSAGAGRAFYSMVSKEQYSKNERQNRLISFLLDEGFTESFAKGISSIFEYAIISDERSGAAINSERKNEVEGVRKEQTINYYNHSETKDNISKPKDDNPAVEAIDETIKTLDHEIYEKKKTITSIEGTIRNLERGNDKSSIDLARRLLDKNKRELQSLLHKRKKIAGEEPHNDSEEQKDIGIIEKEKKTMLIQLEDGTSEEVEVIINFEFKDTKKEFIIYTKNEKDENGDITVYTSYVDRSKGSPVLMGVDDNDWPRVKQVIHELSKS